MTAKRKSKAKNKSRPIQMTDPAQSARFLEMAKKLEVDESGEPFERAIGAIQASRPKKP